MGETPFVVNAWPLIFLSQIEALPLLRQLSAEVVVTTTAQAGEDAGAPRPCPQAHWPDLEHGDSRM